MYDSARDCFTEQQVAEQKALAAEAATRADQEREPRRRISTVGDLLSPVDDAASAASASSPPATSTPAPSKPSSSSPPTTATTTTTTTTTTSRMPDTHSAPLKRKDRERGGTPPSRENDAKRRRGNSPYRDNDARRRRGNSPYRDDRRRRRDDDNTGKRRRVDGGGSGPSPEERNIYAPRRRSRSRSPRGGRQPYQRRPVSPGSRYRFRSPPPLIPRRDPSPPPQVRDTSPPRQRKRPGQSARFTEAEREAHRAAIAKREAEAARLAKESIQARGVNEIVKAHYNDKPELGKTWRETQSQIKGLRSFNNWVKSTIIQKFSPNDGFDPRASHHNSERIFVLDMGCGKGGDLLKWKSAPQPVELYVGVDTADVSIDDARERYNQMRGGNRRGGRPLFDARFYAMDCWSHWIGELPLINDIGADPNVGPGAATRWSKGGGFDVVTMMFCMHYAFESETKCATMLRNVAGALKKGGRFIGTIPSSDVISARVRGEHLDPEKKKEVLKEEGEDAEWGVQEWGNSKYRVRFAEPPPRTGVFRPPWGWKYNFFLKEAVEEVPEYVVPWEAFRAIAEDYSLELIYKKPFHDIWREEREDRDLKELAERMGVVGRDGSFAIDDEQWDACGLYLGFAFRKI